MKIKSKTFRSKIMIFLMFFFLFLTSAKSILNILGKINLGKFKKKNIFVVVFCALPGSHSLRKRETKKNSKDT